MRLLSEQTCRRFYPVQISSRMLCAGFPQGGVDSCSVSALGGGSGRSAGPEPHPRRAGVAGPSAHRRETYRPGAPLRRPLLQPAKQGTDPGLEFSLHHCLLGI